jgi:anti-anti-sigma regulatory factor
VTYRIQRAKTEVGVTFSVSGEMDTAHATELRALLAREPNGPVRLDLADVTLVTLDGVAFLSSAEAEGIVLVNCPDYVRRWIAEHDPRRLTDL